MSSDVMKAEGVTRVTKEDDLSGAENTLYTGGTVARKWLAPRVGFLSAQGG